jgi:hypothetical protein
MTSVLEHNNHDASEYLDYNYGIDETDLSLTFVNTSNGHEMIQQGDIENPFFVGETGGSLSKLSNKEIYANFSKVYVVCMKDNFSESSELYKSTYGRVVNKNNLIKQSAQFTFIKTSMNLLRQNYYKRCACILNRDTLVSIFGFDRATTENEEIIIPMFELTETLTRTNLSLYDKQYSVTDLKDFIALTDFYNKDYKKPVIAQLSEHIENLRESQFWSNPRNCAINATSLYSKRGFVSRDKKTKHSISELAHNVANSELGDKDKLLASLMKPTQDKNTDLNYVSFDDDSQSNPFVDLHTVLKASKTRTYFLDDVTKLELSKEDITEIFMELDDEATLFSLFNTLATSKEYCHTVVNNKEVLIKMKPFFKKYQPVYKMILGYSWLSFVLEEYIMKTKSTINNRFVFDIHTACELPSFPFIFDDVHQNPYIVAPIDLKVLKADKNAVSLFCIDGFDGYGVCDFKTFQNRFNLITTGQSDRNILTGIDWNSFAISGSVVTACLRKKSPLFLNVEHKALSVDENTLKFFNSYYADSDIDMMCNDLSIFGFTEKAHVAIEQIKKNILNYKEGDLDIAPVKSLYICLSKHFFSEKIDNINDALGTSHTVEELIKMTDSPELKEFLYPYYVENKQKSKIAIRKSGKSVNDYMRQFMNFANPKDINVDIIKEGISEYTFDSDICLHVNDFKSNSEKVPDSENFLVMKICEGIKFKLTSPKLRKEIELFRCKSNDFFGIVGKFHLPCVRSYYNGNNVYLFPSDITAMMTGINIDYRYFCGIKNKIDILNKYRTRDFGTLLSEQELLAMIDHNVNTPNPKCGGMYAIKSKSTEDVAKVMGGRELTDPIFKPLEYTQGLPGVYNPPNVNYIKTMSDLRRYYQDTCGYSLEKFGIDMMKFTTFSPTGDINPYMSSIPKIYYDIVNLHNSVPKTIIQKKKRIQKT